MAAAFCSEPTPLPLPRMQIRDSRIAGAAEASDFNNMSNVAVQRQIVSAVKNGMSVEISGILYIRDGIAGRFRRVLWRNKRYRNPLKLLKRRGLLIGTAGAQAAKWRH